MAIKYSTDNSTDTPNLKRIPFVIIEDILDGQSVTESEKTWSLIELDLTNTMLDPEFFVKGTCICVCLCAI